MAKADAIKVIGVLFAAELIFILFYGLFVDYDSKIIDKDVVGGDNSTATIDEAQEDVGVGVTYSFFQDVNVMVFIGFGFLMTFLRKYGFSAVGYNFLLSAFVIQWAILVLGFWHQVDNGEAWHNIKLTIESLITADFAAAAVLISYGAVLGKFSPLTLLYMAFFEIIFFGMNEWIAVTQFKVVDVGGSMVVHAFGAFFGLGVSATAGKKSTTSHKLNSSVYHSDLFAMIGTIFLWMFWPSFNGALASGAGQHRVVINTTLALTGSVMTAFMTSILLRGGRFDMVDIQNATLAGGVAIGTSADLLVQPFAAIIIGAFAGIVSVAGYVYLTPFLEKLGLQDTAGVLNLHGVPGIIGGLSGAIASSVASEDDYGPKQLVSIWAARAPENETLALALGVDPGDGRSASIQAGFQVAALLVTIGIAFVSGGLTGSLVFFGGRGVWGNPEGKVAFQEDEFWEVPDDYNNYSVLTDNQHIRRMDTSATLEMQTVSVLNTTRNNVNQNQKESKSSKSHTSDSDSDSSV